MTEDFPTLLRPANVTCGFPSRIKVLAFTADSTNSALLKLIATAHLLPFQSGHGGEMLHRRLLFRQRQRVGKYGVHRLRLSLIHIEMCIRDSFGSL